MRDDQIPQGVSASMAYVEFCKLRDQRRCGEEAPEHSELRAFELAVAGVRARPAAPILRIELPDGYCVAFERASSGSRNWVMRNAAGQVQGALGPFQAQLVECALQSGLAAGRHTQMIAIPMIEEGCGAEGVL